MFKEITGTYQLVNAAVKLKQLNIQQKILTPKSAELRGAIIIYLQRQVYLQEEHKHVKYYDNIALKYNVIDLSFDAVIYNVVYTEITVQQKKRQVFKKAINDLVAEGLIYPNVNNTLQNKVNEDYKEPPSLSKSMYYINPLFYYCRTRFAEVYYNYCELTNNKPNKEYLKKCFKTYEGNFIQNELAFASFNI